jgi:hypothetical protein
MSETGSKTGWAAHLVGHGLLRKPRSIELRLMRILRYLYWLSSNSAVDSLQSGRSGFSIQNVEVTFVKKETASSFSTGLHAGCRLRSYDPWRRRRSGNSSSFREPRS